MPKIRHEINLLNGTVVGATTANERTAYAPAQYSGTLTVYFEALASISTGSGNVTLTNGTTNYTLSFSSATVTLSRTAAITPALAEYWVVSVANMTVKAARLIIIQDTGASALTSCETQIEIGSRSAVTATTIPTGATATNQTNPKYWFYDSSKWDGTVTFLFEATIMTAASKSTSSVQLQVADGTGDGFTGWANVTNGSVSTASMTTQRVRASSSFTPVDGRWYRVVAASGQSKTAMNVYSAKIVVGQTGSAITKLRPQYLLSNTLLAAGTAIQKFMTKWDSTEWSGVTNAYNFQAEAANGSSSVVQLKTANDVTLLGTVSGPDNAGTYPGGVTMPASSDLDVKAAANNGDLYATRLLVDVVVIPTLEQSNFRARNSDGTETTSTWIASAGTDWTQAVAAPFRVRFLVKNPLAANTLAAQLQYNKNGAGWNNVTATSSVVQVGTEAKDYYIGNPTTSFTIDTTAVYYQTLTASISFTVRSFGLVLRNPFPSLFGNIVFSIQALDGSGVPDGTPLASVTVAANTLAPSAGPTWYYFTLGSTVSVTAGDRYSIVFNRSAVNADFFAWYFTSLGGYAGGELKLFPAGDAAFKIFDTILVADGTATTQQIGSGTFVAGSVDTVDGLCSSVSLAAGQETELEYLLTIVAADVANNDTILLRISGMDTYTDTPVITVPAGSTAPVGKLTQMKQAVHRASYY